MADITIQDIRKKYPQYNDMGDRDLANALHKKYYSDMPVEEFHSKIGFKEKAIQPTERFLEKSEQTLKRLQEPLSVGETAATLATSTYGVPLSGLAGLFALPLGLETARKTVEAVQKGLVYQPQTKGGQQLTEAITYPLQKLEELGGYTGEKIEKAGYPTLGAAAHSAIVGAPVIAAGGRAVLKPSPAKMLTKIDAKISQAIDHGINKAIRPSVVKKEMYGQVETYRNKARTAVKEIIKNRDNLNIIDESGARISGLPKTLNQFSQAIEQVKRSIFEEYDSLAKQADKVKPTRDLKYPIKDGENIVFKKGDYPYIEQNPIAINLSKIGKRLEPLINNKILQDFSPETINYAIERMNILRERGYYTAVETQEAVQLLNQTLKNFYKNPSIEMKGKSLVDSMIANNLRKQLDSVIEQSTGKDYQVLKNKYGALRELETDVTKRSIVDARKNIKGLIDFSDVYTGYHIARGLLAGEPSTLVAGAAAKGIARYLKYRNEPNRIIKSMFDDVEKLLQEKQFIRMK